MQANQTLRYGAHDAQRISIFTAVKAVSPTLLLLLHGGCWTKAIGSAAYLTPLARHLADLGITVANAEYRGVDELDDDASVFDDIDALVGWARQYAQDQALSLVVMGHSAGAHLALWAAACHQLPVVAIAPITDLYAYGKQNPPFAQPIEQLLSGKLDNPQDPRLRAYSPVQQEMLPSRCYLFHGTGDTAVPVSQTLSYHQRARQAGRLGTLVLLENADHFSLVQPPSPYWQQIEAALMPYLIGAKQW